MIKVCHMTSVHSSDDTRIFHKECVSLANAGYEVYLVAPGDDAERQGVNVVGCGVCNSGRLKRMTTFSYKVYRKALALDCDIYHIHDPELIPYVKRLSKKGKKVIFDSHEDYTFEKNYIPQPFRKMVNSLYIKYEKSVCRRLSGLICCYHWTQERLGTYCPNNELLFNFPILKNFKEKRQSINELWTIGYAGGVDSIWNHKTIIEAIASIDGVEYALAGRADPKYLEEIERMPGWAKVKFYGKIPHDEVMPSIYDKANVAVALLDYIPECKGNLGNLSNTKLFEMMMMGLPVICTDFVIWKNIIEAEKCGICVNPHDTVELVRALSRLKENPTEAEEMGQNGRKAILTKYNWTEEAEKLFSLYERILLDIRGKK